MKGPWLDELDDKDEDFPVAQFVGSTFVPENAVMQGTVSSEEDEDPSPPSSGPLNAVTWYHPMHTPAGWNIPLLIYDGQGERPE